MTIKEIAQRMITLNQEGKYHEAYQELFSDDIVSVERGGAQEATFTGREGIELKSKDWAENLVEMHEFKASEPLVSDNGFAVTFYIDATFKNGGRMQMTELAVYQVKEGKIIREEFWG
jgi:ketosteroid isomerase-like protein